MTYKGWRIESQPNKADADDGWRAYAVVTKIAYVRMERLSRKDARVFPTREIAEAAGVQLAKVWIYHEESPAKGK